MHLQCVTCPKLGISCDGPRFFAMPPQELISWCKERKKHLRYTNAKLAELSGVPQGTIDSLFANTHTDFKFGTIRTILQVLVGADWSGDPCPAPSSSSEEENAMRERIKQLENDMQRRDDKMQHFADENKFLKERIADESKSHRANHNFMREQLRSKDKTIFILSVLLSLALVVIIGALIVDRIDGSKGFIWLDSLSMLFQGGAYSPIIDRVT